MPRFRQPRSPLVLSVALLVVLGCTSPGGPAATGDRSAGPVASDPTPTTASSPTSGQSPASSDATDAPIVTLDQAWATLPLTDVATGESFRIADHAGKVVIVETMAIWCSNCRRQQGDVQEALHALPADRVVYVVLDVDPNEAGASLAAYQQQHGFAGRYAIAGGDVSRALADAFGDQFLNPPSTPILFIGTDGTITATDFGHKSVDQLVDLAVSHGA